MLRPYKHRNSTNPLEHRHNSHSAYERSHKLSVSLAIMVVKAVLGSLTAIISLIGVGIGFFFSYIPWIENDDGTYSSLNESYNLCQTDFVAIFASQECSDIESLWLMGNACCGLSLIFLIFSLLVLIIPSRRKETTIVMNTQGSQQMWCAECPGCGSLNAGIMKQMEGQVKCGGCGILHSPESLIKYDP